MRYMTFIRSDPATMASAPPQALMEAMGGFIQEGFASGTLVDTGGLLDRGARVRLRGGRISVTDGPYAEAKEIVGGYAVLECGTQDEAVASAMRLMELHREHWPGWEGECEVRQMQQVPAPA